MIPCIDCRIFLLRKAKEYMAECGADFVITGEVLGQRPMSQRRNTLNLIERESGLEGLLLRPLSAGHFAPTIPEQEGWVDRSRLPAIQGRSRKEQMKLAEELDITNYPCPAGGCLLTEVSFVSKIRDVFDHCEQPAIRDFQLLKVGRHFRVGADTKVIIGRNEAENETLEKMANSDEVCIRWYDGSGPMGIVTGESDDTLLQKAGKILLRYTKAIPGTECSLKVACEGGENIIPVINDFDDARLEEFRV
jgi:tRNA U34 2-thiouridine synthase MnmA/TrmU